MTELIVGDVAPLAQFQADGVQTTFFFPFPILAADDLQVLIDASPALQTTTFTIDGVGDSAGGSVVFDAPPPAGSTVTVYRATPVVRTTDFLPAGEFRATVINEELDRLTVEMQEADARLDRSLGAPWHDGSVDMTLPDSAARADRVLGFDSSGLPITRFMPDSETAGQVEALADQAETAVNDAQAWALKSQTWAENPEDIAVEAGQFSALHHAAKAAASAAAAETFDPASYVPRAGGGFSGLVGFDRASESAGRLSAYPRTRNLIDWSDDLTQWLLRPTAATVTADVVDVATFGTVGDRVEDTGGAESQSVFTRVSVTPGRRYTVNVAFAKGSNSAGQIPGVRLFRFPDMNTFAAFDIAAGVAGTGGGADLVSTSLVEWADDPDFWHATLTAEVPDYVTKMDVEIFPASQASNVDAPGSAPTNTGSVDVGAVWVHAGETPEPYARTMGAIAGPVSPNLVPFSDDLTQWTPRVTAPATVTADVVEVATFGAVGDRVDDASDAESRSVFETVAVTPGERYTLNVAFAKNSASAGQFPGLRIFKFPDLSAFAAFDIAAGVAGTGSAENLVSTIREWDVDPDFWHCSITAEIPAGVTSVELELFPASHGINVNAVGNDATVTGSVEIGAVWFHAGETPEPYARTTGAAALPRNAGTLGVANHKGIERGRLSFGDAASELKLALLNALGTTELSALTLDEAGTLALDGDPLVGEAGFTNSLATSGYQKLPGGLIVQWTTSPLTGGSETLTWPIAFPTAALIAVAGTQKDDATNVNHVGRVVNFSATEVTVKNEDTGGTSKTILIPVIAIGH